MKRTGLQRQRKPLSRGSGLKAKPRPRLGVQERQEAEVFKASVGMPPDPCAACGSMTGWIHAHHVVYQQHLKAEHRWDPRNALPLCHDCHHDHHCGARRVPLEVLTDDNLNFASAVLGASAGDYLRRRYARSIVENTKWGRSV